MSLESYNFFRDLSVYSSGSFNFTCHGLTVKCQLDRRDLTWSTSVEIPRGWRHSSDTESILKPAGIDPSIYQISLASSHYRDVLFTMQVSHVNNFRHDRDGPVNDMPYHTVGELITTTCALIKIIVNANCCSVGTGYSCSNRPLRTPASHRRQVPEYSPDMDTQVLVDTFSRKIREIFTHRVQVVGKAELPRQVQPAPPRRTTVDQQHVPVGSLQKEDWSTGHSWDQEPRPVPHVPFQTAPYQTAPCQTAPYQTAPCQTAPYQTAPYQTAPYQTAPYQTAPCQTAPARHYSEPPETSPKAHFGTIRYHPSGRSQPMINIPDIEGLDPKENREMRQVIMSGLVDMGVVPGSSNSYSRDRERLILQSLVDNIERYTDLADSRHHSEMPNLVNSHQSIEVPSSDEPFTSETISSVRAEDNVPVPRDVGYTEDQTSATNSSNCASETEVSIGDCSDEE